MELNSRTILCTSILQHATFNLQYSDDAGETECFEQNISVQIQGIPLVSRIILCPCPRVLGAIQSYFLVKGPINMSVLLYMFLPNTNIFTHTGFAENIGGGDYNPPGQSAQTSGSSDPSPPLRTPQSSDVSGTNGRT